MSYGQLALVYDQFMAHAPYDKWAAFTEEMITASGKQAVTMLDLGCGTGEIAIRLAEAGYNVTGVDVSADMLSAAEQKSSAKKLPVEWMKQDIRELQGFFDVDVCISYCDVMNYITTEADLTKIFTHVHACLAEDGFFIFDVHDSDYATNMLMNQTFADVTEQLAYIWDCEEGDVDGEMFHHLTFFQSEQGSYTRFDEMHHQRVFSRQVYETLLKNAGFRKVTFYSDFQTENTIIDENSERIFILAEK